MADPVIYMLHMLLYLNLRSKRHRRRFNGHLHDPIPIHGNFSLEVALERLSMLLNRRRRSSTVCGPFSVRHQYPYKRKFHLFWGSFTIQLNHNRNNCISIYCAWLRYLHLYGFFSAFRKDLWHGCPLCVNKSRNALLIVQFRRLVLENLQLFHENLAIEVMMVLLSHILVGHFHEISNIRERLPLLYSSTEVAQIAVHNTNTAINVRTRPMQNPLKVIFRSFKFWRPMYGWDK